MSVNLNNPEWYKVYITGVTLNIVSLICASSILVTLLILGLHNPKVVNRISLRLQAGIALVDILNHINNIYHWSIPSGSLCVFSGFFRVFGRQLYCFLNIAIALNLQLIFINQIQPNPTWELYYWACPFILASLMNVVPLGLGMYGYNGERCFIKETEYDDRLLAGFNLALVILFTFVYCSVVAIMVMTRLRTNLNVVKNLAPHREQIDPQAHAIIEQSLKRLIYRIALYPIAAVISMFFYFIVYILFLMDIVVVGISQLALLSLSLTGILNLIAFGLDPTLHNAFRALILVLRSSNIHNVKLPETESAQSMELHHLPSHPNEIHHQSTNLPSVGGNNNLHLL